MRPWYFGSTAAVLCVTAAIGFMFLASGRAQEKQPGDGPPRDGPSSDGQAASKIAQSRIDRVTVYPNSALVTREVDVPEGNGLTELVVSPMPNQIVPNT